MLVEQWHKHVNKWYECKHTYEIMNELEWIIKKHTHFIGNIL